MVITEVSVPDETLEYWRQRGFERGWDHVQRYAKKLRGLKSRADLYQYWGSCLSRLEKGWLASYDTIRYRA